jgi:transposase
LAAWKQRNRNPNVLEERRRNAVQLMLRGDIRKIDLSESLGVSYTSIKNWWNAFEDNGNSIEALAPKKREGRCPRMTKQQLRRLERMLLKGPMEFGFETDLWTTERVEKSNRGRVWNTLPSRPRKEDPAQFTQLLSPEA